MCLSRGKFVSECAERKSGGGSAYSSLDSLAGQVGEQRKQLSHGKSEAALDHPQLQHATTTCLRPDSLEQHMDRAEDELTCISSSFPLASRAKRRPSTLF